MPASMLQRAAEALGAHTSCDADTLQLLVDIVQQVLDARRSRTLGVQEREWLARTLGSRLGIGAPAVTEVFEIVRADRARTTVRPDELRVLASWYGDAAAAAATRDVTTAASPADFASEHGLDEALLLFDLLVQLTVADGQVDPGEVAGLQRVAAELSIDPTFVAALLSRHNPRLSSSGRKVPLSRKRIRIGRATTCEIVLPSPQVEARHAELLRTDSGWLAVQSGRRPLVVNGATVRTAPVAPGSELRIGPYLIRLEADQATIIDEHRLSALTVRGLHRRIRTGGQDTVLLDDVGFTALSGEVIAVVGPSGSGKTTLVNAISGVQPADRGEVLLDGVPFHALLRADPALLAEVPQDDLVLPQLTVQESLAASGRLRLASDLTDAELDSEVQRVLTELGIADIAHRRIGSPTHRGISGGQRKRVNVGQELLTRSTRLLFLDEPLSGLDPQASIDLVRLVRRLADQGRIVFLVTHDLSAGVIAQVDHLLVLAQGGRMAWFGPPVEACAWFDVATPDAIFDRLGEQAPEAWRDDFRGTAAWRSAVETREHLLTLGGHPQADPDRRATTGSSLRSFWTLVRRFTRVKLRDRTGLMVLLAQPVLLAAVLLAVFGHTTAALMFMLTLSCLWFGMSGAVRELIVDRGVWRRERRVGVGVLPYVMSKASVLALVNAAQAVLMVGVVHAVIGMGSAGVDFAALALTGVLTAWAGMSLGLLVGAAWGSSEAAVGTLVLLLVPQIAFSGILTPLTEVTPAARAGSVVTVQRYALHAAIMTADEITYRNPTRGWQTHPSSGTTYSLGLRPGLTDDTSEQAVAAAEGLSQRALLAIITAFALAQLAGAMMLIARKPR